MQRPGNVWLNFSPPERKRVTASRALAPPQGGPLPDGQGTRITFNNGGHQDVKQLIADVLRQLNISA